MKFAVLGTGDVGKTIAGKLVNLGHEVMMGSRSATSPAALAWVDEMADERAMAGTFENAAAFGEWVFNCTSGMHALDALSAADAENLAGKILVDLSNPLDFSQGFPPALSVQGHDSLGEQIQRAFPKARVVKTLNTVHNSVMVDPARVPGDHQLFISGDDEEAKAEVSRFLTSEFGWKNAPLDLGDIKSARGTEAYLLLWVRLYSTLKTGDFNLKLEVGAPTD